MPREHKKRGRRDESKKRKLTALAAPAADDDDPHSTKRQKTRVDEPADVTNRHPPPASSDRPFYGLLDEDEQEYFRRADELLELNQFADSDERSLFLANAFREAEGKELKMANSQSCSRLMERLISLSSPAQLKNLFRKFSGNFLYLADHRFASHCCEALFTRAAPVVTQELTDPSPDDVAPEEVYVSMENLFLYALNELEGNLGYLLTSRYASHVLRVLLVVFSGLPLASSENRSLLQGRGKERITVNGGGVQDELALRERVVPESFSQALKKLSTDALGGMDTTALRALASHPTGNPTVQLLIQVELTKFGKQRAKDETSIIRRLLPDDPITEETESASFINGLVYDPIGSRLLETIIDYAPGKMFRSLHRGFFKERIGTLARNEVAGFVVSKLLQRMSKEDLRNALNSIIPQFSGLVDRNRTSVIRTLIERCAARGVDTGPIARELQKVYEGPNGFDIARVLKLGDASADDNPTPERSAQPQPDKLHGSLLAQSMAVVPGPLSDLLFDSLARLSAPLSLKVSKDTSASHALQAALTSPHATVIFRRKMIQQFYGHVAEMALDPSASHVIDAIWNGTQGLAFIRERIAEELAENEASLRESFVGRAVWRNWQMDLYKRKRADWVKKSRVNAGNEGFVSFPEANGAEKEKTALDLAREKHAANKTKRAKKASKRGKEAASSQ